jgi:hypothetical protein
VDVGGASRSALGCFPPTNFTRPYTSSAAQSTSCERPGSQYRSITAVPLLSEFSTPARPTTSTTTSSSSFSAFMHERASSVADFLATLYSFVFVSSVFYSVVLSQRYSLHCSSSSRPRDDHHALCPLQFSSLASTIDGLLSLV